MLRSPRLIHLTVTLAAPGRQCLRQSPSPRPLLFPYARTGTEHAIRTSSILPNQTSPPSPQGQALAACSDLASQKFSLIYAFPAIKALRAVSRLKLMQTGITAALLPTVSYFYLQGQASGAQLTYATGIAAFAAVMLYVMSHYIRRVVGMMYLDSTQTILKVSHLTFWGHRRDMYLPVADVKTVADTGDVQGEVILQLKQFGCSDTLYFSLRFGRVVDRQGFEKVFGTLS
ncbi:transmembrane protein 186 [Salminus brasiliensis]|uniref:transmembrane protein 186 n=1 Tax=Salminus brasiliensis TaxID=930266 RepID=UPI003B836FB6